MPRAPRVQIENGLYHVTARGDRKEAIYEDDQDRRGFLSIVNRGMLRFDAFAYAYCLMGNHYHLLVHTPGARLSQLMHYINGVYTQYSNRRHGRCGHVFQGRFHSVLIDRDAYFLEVCRYVDLNPVRAGLVGDPGSWQWSSYRSHAGLVTAPSWLDTRYLHEHLTPDTSLEQGALRYRRFVAEGLESKEKSIESFCLAHSIPQPGERAMQTIAGARLSLEKYFEQGKRRNAAILAAFTEGGYSMSAIAAALQMSVSRISRVIRDQTED